MSIIDLAALVITLAAGFAWINHRFIGLPNTVGVMLLAIAVSATILVIGSTGFPSVIDWSRTLLLRVDFSRTLLDGMLSFLLFAGALFVNFNELAGRRYVVGTLATLGVMISTGLVASAAWWCFNALGFAVPFSWCLVFGALIAPTDPIAVLGILKSAGVPRSLEAKIVGESLFNDGIAVVVFLVMLEIATTGHTSAVGIATLFLQEAVGGALLGLAIGWLAHHMLRAIDQYQVEVLITLAVVTGGSALAHALHLSAPIAMVLAGLLLGHHERERAMSQRTQQHLDHFWELVDEILNAVLFVLLGLEVVVLSFGWKEIVAALLMIPAVLLARFASVAVPVALLRPFRDFSPGVVTILTWGGLRGGISVALVLALPAGPVRDILLPTTYAIVLFSLVVQGLTVGRVARRLAGTT